MATMNGNGHDHNEEAELAREMQNAQYATDLLNNPLFSEVFEILADRIMNHWRKTAPSDAIAREDDWKQLHAMAMVRALLIQMISSGNLADTHMRAEVNKRKES